MAHPTSTNDWRQRLREVDAVSPDYARTFVDNLLAAAVDASASDVHIQPVADGLWVRWRIDGVLQDTGTFPAGESSDVVTRLKVLGSLLTYRSDVPQEGRLQQDEAARATVNSAGVEMRLSTFPTLNGERAVVRLFVAQRKLEQLADLRLPADIAGRLEELLCETSGAVLVTGPAGSGKTTTCYAALRHLVADTSAGRNIVSIEDPVEIAVDGVAQSQVQASAGFDLASGLRALLRQDPEVLMVSEIRDPVAAQLALGASLTGHLVIGSFHAGSAAAAVSRMIDMGVEPYVLRSGVLAVLCQRLVRRLCTCARPFEREDALLGLPIGLNTGDGTATSASSPKLSVGCEDCLGTGYRGRTLIAELLLPREGEFGQAIVAGADAGRLEQLAVASGMVTRWQRAVRAVECGITSPAEIRRVLGFDDPWKERAKP